MLRTLLLSAGLLAAASPALAETDPDCSGLIAARASLRTIAAAHDYQVFDLDGPNALAFERDQEVSSPMITTHLTVMTNPQTGRSVALFNDAPGCAFGSVAMVLAPHTSALDSALDALRLAR